MAIPEIVSDLVARFDRNREAYRSIHYNETQLRREFLDPFFEALGWDVTNKGGHAEAYKDVIHEDAIKVGGATKAPDYCFRIGGTRKFFVEAKKPAVDIKDDIDPAYQLRRYAWSAKLPLSILTDFEEFAVYDCRMKPTPADKASTARTIYATYTEYPQRWDEIASVFSCDAVLKGSFDKYVESSKAKKGTAEVDDAFLEEIESWRDLLARHLALRNPDLTQRELNFSVQRIIDRLIFLRICEDRGIEEYGRLMAQLNGGEAYARLCHIFQRADERYNSGLFHFRQEKDRAEPPDKLTLRLSVDDKPLKEIIKNLYYPDSPYEFSVLPADILGQVYEQFLGKVIRLTSGHRAVVEDKPEVKKAGGVYYTPTYIVDYIVKNTVGELLKGKTPKQVAKSRILDPACGSGSFLIGAYQALLDWHRDWYAKNGPRKWATGRSPVIYQASNGDWRLTTAERKRILVNNIYGVDIDSQAVEVTKLSLLLKVLEGENEQTLTRQLVMFHERALPDLANNVKCGNSLIGPDFYDNQQMSFPDEEESYRVNALNWRTEFTAIMKAGGFDVVIGNPPWGAAFTDSELSYLRRKHRDAIKRMVDSYIYFVDRAIQVAKPGQPVGLIVPSTILNQVDAKAIREMLLIRGLSTLINLGQGIFGSKVLNTSTILISGSRNVNGQLALENLSDYPLKERRVRLNAVKGIGWRKWMNLVRQDPHLTFFVGNLTGAVLLSRLRREHIALSNVIIGGLQRGVSPDVAEAHVVVKTEARSLEKKLLRPGVSGSQIKRYRDWTSDQFIIYTTRETQIGKFPNVLKRLEGFKHLNSCREVVQGKHPWWALHRPRDPKIFTSPKFIGVTTSKSIELIYDPSDSIYVTDAMYVFKIAPECDPWACLAILQSKLFLFLYRVENQGESRVIPQVKGSKLETVPYPSHDVSNPTVIALSQLCKTMFSLHKQLTVAKIDHDKAVLERQIEATDGRIDQLVYELYGLTEKEIEIVKEETKLR